MRIRPPAVAGSFYPDDPVLLAGMVDGYLADVPRSPAACPRALVAPHAGYLYSGPIAAHAFGRLRGHAGEVARVVLLGPSHYVPLDGLALPTVAAFATPLGTVALDPDAAAETRDLPQVARDDRPHAREHSLEVELPFLQRTLGEFRLVPLVVGDAAPAAVAAVIERLAGTGALVVVSTDLSHYLPAAEAQARDRRTSAAIEALDPAGIGDEDACGRMPLRGLLAWARAQGLACTRLDLRHSGDTAGPPDHVVGYGAYAFA